MDGGINEVHMIYLRFLPFDCQSTEQIINTERRRKASAVSRDYITSPRTKVEVHTLLQISRIHPPPVRAASLQSCNHSRHTHFETTEPPHLCLITTSKVDEEERLE